MKLLGIIVILAILTIGVHSHNEDGDWRTIDGTDSDGGNKGVMIDEWRPQIVVPIRGLKTEFPPLPPHLTKTYDLVEVKQGNVSHYGVGAAVTGPPCLRGASGECDRAVSACINNRHYLSLFCNCFDYYSRSYNCLIDKFCGHD